MPRWARGPRICDPSFIMKQGQPIMNRLLPLTVALAIAVLLPVTAAARCSTCGVSFPDADAHRAHAKSEWHVTNLKRAAAGLRIDDDAASACDTASAPADPDSDV